MTDDQQLIHRPESQSELRSERREFFRAALGAAAVTAAGAAGLSLATSASAAAIADNDLGNFLLQIDYLAAQYYSFAVTGAGLPAAQLTGGGTAGAATGARQVSFTDPLLAKYAAEIAQDLAANVSFLRTQLGTDGVLAQPAIDLGTAPTGAFSTLARAAGIVASGVSFDPYASDENFLIGAFMIEDVIVSAYAGASGSITDKTLLGSIAGLLATHAHHAAVIRALLYAKGSTAITKADAISDIRDGLDGTGTANDIDQGLSPATVGGKIVSNIVPAGPDGLSYGRSVGQVLNILYLTSAAVSIGGFFTAGLNGVAKTSAAH